MPAGNQERQGCTCGRGVETISTSRTDAHAVNHKWKARRQQCWCQHKHTNREQLQMQCLVVVLTVQCVEHLECFQCRAHDGLYDVDVEVLICLPLGGHLPVDLVVCFCMSMTRNKQFHRVYGPTVACKPHKAEGGHAQCSPRHVVLCK